MFRPKLHKTLDQVTDGSSSNPLSTALTGFVVGSNTSITSSDTILTAFEKTQAQINAISGATSVATPTEVVNTAKSYNISCWGDSLTAGSPDNTISGNFPLVYKSLTNKNVINNGISGDTSSDIYRRFINATGEYTNSVIIWAGRNNFEDPATVLADIAAMVAALGHTRYIVLSILNGSTNPNPSLSYTQITSLNASLASVYGTRYLDVRSYLVSQYNPLIPQDVLDFAADVVPSSLRVVADPIHLNTAGHSLVANYIYSQKATILSPIVNKIVYVEDVVQLLHNTTPSEFKQAVSIVGQGNLPAMGNTLVTNGTFAGSLTGWTAGANWSYSSGTALHTVGNAATLTQSITLEATSTYHISFDVTGRTAGTLTLSFGALLGTLDVTTNGTQTFGYLSTTASATTLTFTPTSTFDGAISNVVVKKLVRRTVPTFTLYNSTGSIADAIEFRASQPGLNNQSIGYASLVSNTTGRLNLAYGPNTLELNTVGTYNVALGSFALRNNINGSINLAIGTDALRENISGGSNTAINYGALKANTSGSSNIAIGPSSLNLNTTGTQNIAIGGSTLLSNLTSSYSTGVGHVSLLLSTGQANTALGRSTGANITSGTFNLVLGAFVHAPSATLSGQLNIGNVLYGLNLHQSITAGSTPTATGMIGIGITTPTSTLHVNGSLGFKGLTSATSTLTLATAAFYAFTGTTSTWTLPALSGCADRPYFIKNRGSGALTIICTGADSMFYNAVVTSFIINVGEAFIFHNDGTYWNIY